MTLHRFRDFLGRCEEGVSSVEFALIVPVLLLILAGIVDFGGALKAKFDLNASVSAASNFAMTSGDNVTSSAGANLATQLSAIARGGLGGNHGTVNININDGPRLAFANGTTTTSTTAGRADLCYCPTRSGETIIFGSAVACGSACSSGGSAGKFVVVQASKPYNPLFGGFGIVEAGNIRVMSVVQPK